MKYGKTLRQRSIPAWSHHNIDYDEVKYYIKESTTPGKGKSVSIPGTGDDKLQEVENGLFDIFDEQHLRIDLFVRSKAGEIRSRLDHAKRQLQQLSAKNAPANKRIPVKRLERYGKLENDVVKAGEEIKCLARFISAQRTGFRKLLKKYKKWSGSTRLEERVRTDILDQPKSFTKTDLGPLLKDYSDTLGNIRSLYETGLQNEAFKNDKTVPNLVASSGLSVGILDASNVDFDTAISTVPIGGNGTFASYLVHPENVVELHIPMLQYGRYFVSEKPSGSSTPSSPIIQRKESSGGLAPHTSDYSMLIADELDAYAREQSALTVNQREGFPGATRQRAKACIRWNDEGNAILALREQDGRIQTAGMKRKHVDTFFDPSSDLEARRGSEISMAKKKDLLSLRERINNDERIQPLAVTSSSRSRFVGLKNDTINTTLATLDTDITICKTLSPSNASTTTFPYAVLSVRYEGPHTSSLVAALDHSHLVERVPGFSLEYHSVYAAQQPQNVSPPFWMPLLWRDIRKLPPTGPLRHSSQSASPTQASGSSGSVVGATDSTTAVEGAPSSANTEMETPQLRSFRKKRTRTYPQQSPLREEPQQTQYWNEYDNPEDEDPGDAYVIYVDPNERTAFDKFISFFSRSPRKLPGEEEGLLPHSATDDSPTSSDDETENELTASRKRAPRLSQPNAAYGTVPASYHNHISRRMPRVPSAPFLPHFTAVCLIASLCILFVAYILVSTGKHKYATEVDAGVIFAIGSCLLFAVVGFASLLRGKGKEDWGGGGMQELGAGGMGTRGETSWLAWGVATVVVIVDAVGSGGLLAWMLG